MRKVNGQTELTATAYTAKAPAAKTTEKIFPKLIILNAIEHQELEILQFIQHHQQAAEKNQIGVVGASAVAALETQSDETFVESTAAELAAAANATAVKIFHIENLNLQESPNSSLNSIEINAESFLCYVI
uniref:Uncharacterized protein n=1 Tax=Bactrocera dorsalis TaxID=27457 RepID=A0A034W8S3_BACDO